MHSTAIKAHLATYIIQKHHRLYNKAQLASVLVYSQGMEQLREDPRGQLLL